jgi:hypothetical protein
MSRKGLHRRPGQRGAEVVDQSAGVAPRQVPERRPAHRLSGLLHRVAALVGGDVRGAGCRGSAGDQHIAVGSDELRCLDRGSSRGAGMDVPSTTVRGSLLPTPCRTRGWIRHRSKASRLWPMARPLECTTSHVGPGATAHRPACSALQPIRIGRHAGRTTAGHRAVDPTLPTSTEAGPAGLGGSGARHDGSVGRRLRTALRCQYVLLRTLHKADSILAVSSGAEVLELWMSERRTPELRVRQRKPPRQLPLCLCCGRRRGGPDATSAATVVRIGRGFPRSPPDGPRRFSLSITTFRWGLLCPDLWHLDPSRFEHARHLSPISP